MSCLRTLRGLSDMRSMELDEGACNEDLRVRKIRAKWKKG